MPRIHELCQPERDFQDPRENKGPMEAQCIGGEEEEMEVEQEEEQVKKGDAASSSFCLPAWGTLEEVAAAAIVSLSQSPLGVCPSPTAVAATLGSQSEDYGLSRQEEVPSTSHDQEDTKSSLPNALQVKKNELVEFLLSRYLTKEPITKGRSAE